MYCIELLSKYLSLSGEKNVFKVCFNVFIHFVYAIVFQDHSSGQVAVHLLTVCQLSRTLQRTQPMFIHNGVNALKEHEKLLFRSTHARLDEFIVD